MSFSSGSLGNNNLLFSNQLRFMVELIQLLWYNTSLFKIKMEYDFLIKGEFGLLDKDNLFFMSKYRNMVNIDMLCFFNNEQGWN